ncbi:hypothetical protein BDN70DRAFT_194171 [Pholiota conissans]|uniref:Uncharacterized protein n=1 Tax=Pholiota conissans TaxID=109636 RepID=A0A9P5YVV0_9AGAR|nr:hypothetical protein BDN70DRAFT_194171 [Pholiota conissans]
MMSVKEPQSEGWQVVSQPPASTSPIPGPSTSDPQESTVDRLTWDAHLLKKNGIYKLPDDNQNLWSNVARLNHIYLSDIVDASRQSDGSREFSGQTKFPRCMKSPQAISCINI